MKAGMRTMLTSVPLIAPMIRPTASAAKIAGTTPATLATLTATTAHSPRVEPTDRSKVPDRMAMVMPMAATPTNELWRSTLIRLSRVAKLGMRMAAITHTTSSTAVIP